MMRVACPIEIVESRAIGSEIIEQYQAIAINLKAMIHSL
jgi:hypothetical protein